MTGRGRQKDGHDEGSLPGRGGLLCVLSLLLSLFVMQGCADADLPGARNVSIPNPTMAAEREEAINERPDSVMYLPLGKDVLIPEISADDPLPGDEVGPFELRSETLAGALQLILADYDVSLAFESENGLTRQITVANLRGPLNKVVRRICALANMYCAYEDGLLVVKETQTFTVKIPPISQDTEFMTNIATGLQAVIGFQPVVDPSTRTLIYEATQRTAGLAERYFQRMRSSTALIVFETYIWEVSLNSGNSTGIKWENIDKFGKFVANASVAGSVGADFSNPISIGLPTTQGADGGPFTSTDVFDFLSQFGAVKTISQPQITVLSGSEAKLRAADTENYVAEISETIDNGQSSTSVSTSSVDTGFTVTIASAWDNASIYANISILLSDVSDIEDFTFSSANGGDTIIQLPKTTERELETQVRIRPGDSLLIAGLVRESDNFSSSGPGTAKPLIPTSRSATAQNLELVFLLRPRVIVYTSPSEEEYYETVRGAAYQHPHLQGHPGESAAAGAEPVTSVLQAFREKAPQEQKTPAAAGGEGGWPEEGDDKLVFEYDFAPLIVAPGSDAQGGEP
ncbi:MAG: type II and III secretion system family protein [Alphaproteobacteria bacterium]|nr:type II and III secretion system family protein [Alphaproteobacteria bacterium]